MKDKTQGLNFKVLNLVILLTGLLVGVYILKLILPIIYPLLSIAYRVILPFIVAFGLALLLNPIVELLCAFKLSRKVAIIITYLLIGGGFVFLIFNLIPYIVLNIQELIDRLPALLETFQQLLDKLQLDFELTNFFDYTKLIQDNENMMSALKHILSYLGRFLSSFSSGFSTVFGMIILVPVILFYILSSFHEIRFKIKMHLIKKQKKKLYVALKQCEDVVTGYISGTLFISFLLSVIATIFFSIIGLPNAIVFGIIIGIANIVPYVGQIIATVPPALFGLTVSPLTPVIVVAGIMVLNFIESNFFRPIIISKAINFHPVILLTLIILGGQIFGLMGMLVIIPVAGIVRVLSLYSYDLLKTFLVKKL